MILDVCVFRSRVSYIFYRMYIYIERDRVCVCVSLASLDRRSRNREWVIENRMGNHSEIMVSLILSPSADDSFRQIDSYSLRDVTPEEVDSFPTGLLAFHI